MSGLPLIFLNPWVLAGLAALPVLWFILRVMPPLPKNIYLPTARFLLGLNTNRTTPDSAPWWLILLRILILAFLILAFAGPVLNPKKPDTGKGPFNLVFDNGWASAQVWTQEITKAEEILEAARDANRPVRLILTASDNPSGFIRADEALNRLRSAEPQSWPGTFNNIKSEKVETHFISSGIADEGFYNAAEILATDGLTVYLPSMKERPGLIHAASANEQKSLIKLETPSGGGDRNLALTGFDAKGRRLGQLNKTVTGQTGGEDVTADTGLFSDKKISRWQVTNFAGAGGIYLNDISRGTELIGIVSAASAKQDNFYDAAFYISRALENSKIEQGAIDQLIKKNCTIIVLPDTVNFSLNDLSSLQKFIDKGGVVLRFGGKAMSEADNNLIPVPLKTGMRSLSGDMTWATPLKPAPFPKSSPFANEPVPDITIERQLLAEPSADLEKNTWAKLSDGTPFITAKNQGRGLLILVHTTATPEWSDFVLSGFYVKFLKEILELSSLPDKSQTADTLLQPSLVLNGWGQLVTPPGDARPISRKSLETIMPNKNHPPGIYGNSNKKIPLNLGDRIESLDIIDHLPAGAKSEALTITSEERKLSTTFFSFAALLFLIDWLLLVMLPRMRRFGMAVVILCFLAVPAKAETDVERAAVIHLACLHTSQDSACQTGLDKVSATIKMRTSAEISTSVIVDAEKDNLSFYPLIYWPVDTSTPLSPAARTAIASYLSKGGMLLIDTRDGAYATGQIVPTPATLFLREQLQGMDIPLLKPARKDHVLFKTFYLLNIYPEYDLSGKIWVSEDSMPPDEKLSSVIITGEDWLSKWAYPSDPRSEDMALRFGVNLTLYALTGNYKSDQVHMKAILERMGR